MPHLLLVDDDEDLLSLLTNFFRRHAHTVSSASDGPTMFAVLEKHPIDLVILDVMLKDEDGFSLCRRLRAASSVPVIMLTAMADHTDRVVGLEIGADDYLTKPFDQRELLARVKAVLRRTAETVARPKRSDTRPAARISMRAQPLRASPSCVRLRRVRQEFPDMLVQSVAPDQTAEIMGAVLQQLQLQRLTEPHLPRSCVHRAGPAHRALEPMNSLLTIHGRVAPHIASAVTVSASDEHGSLNPQEIAEEQELASSRAAGKSVGVPQRLVRERVPPRGADRVARYVVGMNHHEAMHKLRAARMSEQVNRSFRQTESRVQVRDQPEQRQIGPPPPARPSQALIVGKRVGREQRNQQQPACLLGQRRERPELLLHVAPDPMNAHDNGRRFVEVFRDPEQIAQPRLEAEQFPALRRAVLICVIQATAPSAGRR